MSCQAEAAVRSDWFESYPYQKFEDPTARTGEQAGLLDTVGEAVGSVRQSLSDLGGGVVNGALGLVGAETLREKLERQEVAQSARHGESRKLVLTLIPPVPGKPDPLIDFAVDLSYGLPNIGIELISHINAVVAVSCELFSKELKAVQN